MSESIVAESLSKSYPGKNVLDKLSFEVKPGQILGLIGRNGAGKTTLLKCLLGLTSFQGDLSVLGLDPFKERVKLLERVSYIADVATLPCWMKVSDLFDYVSGIHPFFSKEKAIGFLDKTTVSLPSKIGELSKGMIVQTHLAIILAIDSRVLILDEPTLGLDVVNRKNFYDSLLNHYHSKDRIIILTSHQVEEIEDLLTDVYFIDDGSFILQDSLDKLHQMYFMVKSSDAEKILKLRSLGPLHERRKLDEYHFLFFHENRDMFSEYGLIYQANLADIFTAKVGG